MQAARIVQAVVILTAVVTVAGCAASKEYTSKIFAPRNPISADSQTVAANTLRFLELDSADVNQGDWVTTDIIMGRDSSGSTAPLDKLAQTIPVKTAKSDTATKIETEKTKTVLATAKTNAPEETVPVARSGNTGEVRNKKSRE